MYITIGFKPFNHAALRFSPFKLLFVQNQLTVECFNAASLPSTLFLFCMDHKTKCVITLKQTLVKGILTRRYWFLLVRNTSVQYILNVIIEYMFQSVIYFPSNIHDLINSDKVIHLVLLWHFDITQVKYIMRIWILNTES